MLCLSSVLIYLSNQPESGNSGHTSQEQETQAAEYVGESISLRATDSPAPGTHPPAASLSARGNFKPGQKARHAKAAELNPFHQVVEICVKKTLAAKELTWHAHYGKGENKALVGRIK